MSERRYSDEELSRIFELAASSEPAGKEEVSAPRQIEGEGFTLAELQDIGREAGLEPARIAEAAAAMEASRGSLTLPRRTAWGMPVAVGRVVALPRAPTDREWEMLVAELRNTFNARGRVRSDGNLRTWANGNLVAAVEPTESGYRLRLGTLKGDAMALNAMGVGGLALGAFQLLSGGSPEMLDAMLFGGMGLAALFTNVVRLPRWAQTREQQMDYIASRIPAILRSGPKTDGS